MLRTNVPEFLQSRKQWIVWKRIGRRKQPYGVCGTAGCQTKPQYWASFEDAVTTFEQGGYEGIGYCFSGEPGDAIGIDLDDCVDDFGLKPWRDGQREVGEWELDAPNPTEIVGQIGSYWELSPSRTGLKGFVRSIDEFGGGKRGDFEAYRDNRFFAVTGDQFGPCSTVESVPEGQLKNLLSQFHIDLRRAPKAVDMRSGDFVFTDEIKQRVIKCLEKSEPAVMGSSGSDQAMKVARTLVDGFSLEDQDAIEMFWDHYNNGCSPPWEWSEVEHKIESVRVKGTGFMYENDPELKKFFKPEASGKKPVVSRFKPFPTTELPTIFQEFASQVELSTGLDEASMVLPMLTAVGVLVGTSVELKVSNTWRVKPNLWAGLLGESGTKKSVAYRLAMGPVKELEKENWRRNIEARERFEMDMEIYGKRKNAWKRDKSTTEDPPAEPKKPIDKRFLSDDSTVEALVKLFVDNPRGIGLFIDELAGWFGSHDAYRNGRGADLQKYLSMFDGDSINKDRSSGSIYAKASLLSIFGGIQPSILRKTLGDTEFGSGLSARFIWAYPDEPEHPGDFDKEIESSVLGRWSSMCRILADIPLDFEDANDPLSDVKPREIELSQESRDLYKRWHLENFNDRVFVNLNLRAAYSKFEGYCLKFALIIHLVQWADAMAYDPTDFIAATRAEFETPAEIPQAIEIETMRSAIKVTEWFKNETERVYDVVRGTQPKTDPLETDVKWVREPDIVGWIRGRKEYQAEQKLHIRVIRDARKRKKEWDSHEKVRKHMDAIVAQGFAEWCDRSKAEIRLIETEE